MIIHSKKVIEARLATEQEQLECAHEVQAALQQLADDDRHDDSVKALELRSMLLLIEKKTAELTVKSGAGGGGAFIGESVIEYCDACDFGSL